MEDAIFSKGQRVRYTDGSGNTHTGVVDSQRRGWVMIDMDSPIDTRQGWRATKLMLKSCNLRHEEGGDGGERNGKEEEGQPG